VSGPEVLFVERASYRDGDVALVGHVGNDGLRIGMHALEPWYATGVLLKPDHPAYRAGLAFLAALAGSEPPGN